VPNNHPTRRGVLAAIAALVLLLLLLGCAFWLGRRTAHTSAAPAVPAPDVAAVSAANKGVAPTTVYAHNLLLRQGPHFRIYVRWIRGQMLRTHRDINPSFDDPDSFLLTISKGVISVHLQDLADFLNAGTTTGTPLKNISIQSSGNEIELHGTVHKIVPVKLEGELSPLPGGRVRFHVSSYSVLKMPMKGLLGVFHLKLSDLTSSSALPGVQISGNDIFFDTEKLLPAPHIQGQITTVNVSPQDLTVIYGGSADDETKLSQWHNFIRFRGGDLDFGKLTMRDADITMIDASNAAWFDLDLVNYQAQLVNGYTRMTAQAGLEIYMPSLNTLSTEPTANKAITLEWLKNRSSSLPSDVPSSIRAK
jgi:hypothetical protein